VIRYVTVCLGEAAFDQLRLGLAGAVCIALAFVLGDSINGKCLSYHSHARVHVWIVP
jgi:hypothetical protein